MYRRLRKFEVLVCVCIAVLILAEATWAQRKKKPLVGYEVGPAMDKVVPGEFIVDPPTLENLGFRWLIKGDTNRNASVAVSFRKKGTNAWRKALPMLRVHHEIANQDYNPFRCGNLFAGSVLFLEPATTYEVRFTMTDPDGGAAPVKVVTAKTLAEPKAPTDMRVVHVYPEKRLGAILGIKAAFETVKPGDLVLVHAGVYSEGTLELTQSGEVGKPIIFRGAGDGEAIIQGAGHKANLIEMDRASHVWFEDLTFRHAKIAIFAGRGRAGSKGLVVRRCKIEDVISGIWGNSKDCADWYIADCVLTGTNKTWYPRPRAYMSPSHTGINVYGRGIVVCHNRISRFSDALAVANHGVPSLDPRKQCVAVDFYNNDLTWAQDDAVETDYGCHNIRVYRNRCTNCHTALSAQPTYGGPVYFVRNEAFGITALALKLHNYCTGLEIYHNTFLTAKQGFHCFNKWQNGIVRNNLFLGVERYAMETGSITPYTSLDYNGYRKTDDPDRFLKWYDGKMWGRYPTLAAFTQATGHEQHGIRVDYDAFVKAAMPKDGKTVTPGEVDLRLKPGAAAVDAACVLPNVNDGFAGKAPDLGCFERGQPPPRYGPRVRKGYYRLGYEVRPPSDLVRPGRLARRDYAPARGTTCYLSAQGGRDDFTGLIPKAGRSDGPDGPWQTLDKVNAALKPGDRVFINPGEHKGAVRPARSGEPGRPIQYLGWMPCVYLDGDVILDEKSHVIVRGLYLQGGTVRISGSKHVRIETCTLAGGHIVVEKSSDVQIDDCIIYAVAKDGADAAVVVRESTNVASAGNRIHNYRKAIDTDRPVEQTANVITALTHHPDRTQNPRGTDYYVIGIAGDDAADGTSPATAWATLAKTAAVVGPGDRVFVGTGVYDTKIQLMRSGRRDAPITFVAFQPGAVLKGMWTIRRDHVTVEGLELRHAGLQAVNTRGCVFRNHLVYGGLVLRSCRDFLVEGNRVTRSWILPYAKNEGNGIAISGGGPGVVRQNVSLFMRNNCHLVGNPTRQTRDVTVDGKTVKVTAVKEYIRDVVFEGNVTAFHGEHGLSIAWARDLVVRRNVFCFGGNGHPFFGRNDVQDCRLYNNTLHAANWYIQPFPDSVTLHRRNEWRNNIFAIPGQRPGRAKFFTYMRLEPVPGEREFTLDYSLYWPDGVCSIINKAEIKQWYRDERADENSLSFKTLKSWQEHSGNDRHSLVGDPTFRDPTTFDFRLKPGSPCIDAGDPDAPVPEGGGKRVDLGACEFVDAR